MIVMSTGAAIMLFAVPSKIIFFNEQKAIKQYQCCVLKVWKYCASILYFVLHQFSSCMCQLNKKIWTWILKTKQQEFQNTLSSIVSMNVVRKWIVKKTWSKDFHTKGRNLFFFGWPGCFRNLHCNCVWNDICYHRNFMCYSQMAGRWKLDYGSTEMEKKLCNPLLVSFNLLLYFKNPSYYLY